jgi:hypothetical protein
MARQTKRMKIREQMAAERGPVEVKKPRKKRKPMSEEQRKAAAERLAKAREKKLEEQGGPKNVHPDVLKLPEDATLSLKNVRGWIKTQKDLVSAARAEERAGVLGAFAKKVTHEGYVRNLERYIRDGVYCDMFYGEYMQNRIKMMCIVPAYDKDGKQKRSYGCFYPDLGGIYVGPGRIEVNGEIVEVDTDV